MLIRYHTRGIPPDLDMELGRTQLYKWQYLTCRVEPEGCVASKLT